MKKILSLLSLATMLIAAIAIALAPRFIRSLADEASFQASQIVDGANVTKGETSFHDPIDAAKDDEISIRLVIVNEGNAAAIRTVAKFDLSDPTAPKGIVSANNAQERSDVLMVSPSGASLALVAGSGKKYGPGCTDGCAVPDDEITGGVAIGDVNPGGENSYQIKIHAKVVGDPIKKDLKFRSGNIFDGGDRTLRVETWADPIQANPGDVIEFRTVVINEGNTPINNVRVRAELPTADSMHPTPKSFLTGDSAETVVDTATVNLSGRDPQHLFYLSGHARKVGPGCQGDGCSLPDTITQDGVLIGTVNPGIENSYQVAFKATMTNNVYPHEKVACTGVCSTDEDCKEGLKCLQVTLGGPSGKTVLQCRNPANPKSDTCSLATPTPSPTPTPTPVPPVCNSRCDTNSQCPNGLVCYKENNPASDALGFCRKDSNPTNNLCQDTKVCNSECTSDSQCSNGLVCYKANSSDTKAYCRHKDNPSDINCDNRKEGGFIIRKYFDENGNGKPEDSEKGLSWKFEWDVNADGNWHEYETFEKSNGEGGRVGGYHDGDQIRIREKSVDGWSATSPSEVTIKIKAGETQYMQFGNWKGKPQVLGTTTVKQLPKSGFDIATSLAAITGMSALGFWLKKKSLS